MQYCGRYFEPAEIEIIRELLGAQPPLNRYRLSLAVCERLNWRRLDGRLKEMSCRVAMLRMQADGLFTLPPPRRAQPPAFTMSAALERAVLEPARRSSVDLAQLRVELVSKRDSGLWNAYIEPLSSKLAGRR
jgi:hypothetical protein